MNATQGKFINEQIGNAIDAMIHEWTELLKELQTQIADDYRATDDPADDQPGMCVTIGATLNDDGAIRWSYQTGDNSYSGGAYSHPYWGVGYLYRDTDCAELANSMADEIANGIIW